MGPIPNMEDGLFKKGTTQLNSSATELVAEFLLKKGFHNTLDCFEKETKQAKIAPNQVKLVEECLGKFDVGDKTSFMALWTRALPLSVRKRSFERLDFYLNVYFAVYPLLPGVSRDKNSLKNRMNEFKGYLDNKEIENSKTTEYLSFYALPHFSDPRQHPSCKEIFAKGWAAKMKAQVKQALDSTLSSKIRLVELLNSKKSKIVAQSEVNAPAFVELKRENTALKKKEAVIKSTLVSCQKKWNSFALDLLKMSKEVRK